MSDRLVLLLHRHGLVIRKIDERNIEVYFPIDTEFCNHTGSAIVVTHSDDLYEVINSYPGIDVACTPLQNGKYTLEELVEELRITHNSYTGCRCLY